MKHLYIFLLLLIPGFLSAQQPEISWSYEANRISDSTVALIVKADIGDGWRLFSTKAGEDELNSRIRIESGKNNAVSVLNIKEEGNYKEGFDPLLEMDIKYLQENAKFEILVKHNEPVFFIRGIVEFMSMKGEEVLSPIEAPFVFKFEENGTIVGTSGSVINSGESLAALNRNINLLEPVKDCGGIGLQDAESKGYWGIFVLGFLGGLIALLTPCVFPMIPLTVSFFTKKSGSRAKGIFDAGMYGLFILLIYLLLSIPFHFLDSSNPEILNTISTNVYLNLFFFAIFVVFALSFFGLFEITMPSSLANKADSKSNLGGLAGIFFMALTLALVSFSCTGPILGSLLAGSLSTNGGAWQLTIGMGGFGLALALPFTLFALFPNWLNSLPKSGSWLTSVKIVLGFLELALAVKFLSNADLVKHWGLLKRETFFLIWIIIGILLTLYLFGILRFPQEGKPKLTKIRKGLGITVAAFTIYLIPGLTKTEYANRSLISGFPPPLSYSIYGEDAFKGVEADIKNDYEAALKRAKEENKPLLIDFTGWACVNCRRMEENVWIVPEVKKLIEENYILVSLYVDDRELLPAEEQFIETLPDGSQKLIKTIGNKFATFQNINFSSVSQPLYVALSPDEKLLTHPVGYVPDEKEYADWLQCGIDAFHNK
jgi:cytochrome c biogenesis protein CcdA/thioredoxin-related protein